MIRKSALAALVFVAALVAFPLLAGAHVEIEADGNVSADGVQQATLHVPNECENSTTTSVELNFPATPPITRVDVTPVTGWTAANTTGAGGAVTKLTLTGSLSGSDEQAFALTFATIPAGTDTLEFTALQHCANGDVIRWVEPTPAGGQEPEHPAPVLEIKRAGETSTTTKVPVTPAPVAEKDSGSDSSTGVVIGVVAAVIVVGGVAFLLIRRSRSS